MKQILLILLLIASVIYPSYASDQATLPSSEFADMRRIKQSEVVDVITPLTILLRDGSVAQLSSIDVPGAYGEEIGTLAVTARDILKDLLIGKRVEIYQTRDKNAGRVNRMGHDLVHLKRMDGNVWAQGALLRLGLARVKTNKVNYDLADEMLALEAEARKEKIGIWGQEQYTVYHGNDIDNITDAVGSFAIIEGQIESVALKKNRIYINFGKDWKSDFTVSIAPEDKRAFSKAKLDPLGWGGKTIRVRGSVRDYNGPYLEITHPAAIEFIDNGI